MKMNEEYDTNAFSDDSLNDPNFNPEHETDSESEENVEKNDEPFIINTESNEKQKTRKTKRDSENWACNKRKKLFDQGLEYISIRKKTVPAKKIKNRKDCINQCTRGCNKAINSQERENIFSEFYKLSAKEKRQFLLSTTTRFKPERHKKGASERRKYTFSYFFDVKMQRIEVCKSFYLGTLDISQKPIYTVHNKKNSTSNIASESEQGRHQKKFISDEDKSIVIEHINSFPRVPSHYCRADSSREYLDRNLNITKMYDLDFASEKNVTPVKQSAYRNIFCNNFNLYFHCPKKDLCDLCEEYQLKKRENTCSEEIIKLFEDHEKEKEYARIERDKDRKGDIPVLCFDLENVLSLPKAEVSNFFYKSKFNVYNLTAHLSTNKKIYCAIWTENMMGRSGNDIASALYKIMKRVLVDMPNLTEIILWSDSCVPQNRNSIMSFAMSYIIQEHPNLQKITMKFSTPGHSCVQEIDTVHSCIDRVLSKAEYFSPISLLRLLLKVNRRKPYCVIQMQECDFKNFQECASLFLYSNVPFSKVSYLTFTKSWNEVQFKTTHAPLALTVQNIRPTKSTKHRVKDNELPRPKQSKKKNPLPKNKIEAIKSMYRWMPEVDKQYYNSILPKD